MKTTYYRILFIIFLVTLPLSLHAQSGSGYHPFLDETAHVSLGGFFADKSFTARVDGSGVLRDRDFDFDEATQLSNNDTTWSLVFRWNFGEKWSLQGQYWGISDSTGAALTQDVTWEDIVFKQGTFVNAGVKTKVGRVFFGRRFSQGPRYEFGLGAGVHWLELDAFIEGQAITNLGDSEFYRGSVSAGAPLPNIGAWYDYAFARNWLLQSRVDWFSASIKEYSGGLWNARVGVNWAPIEHISFGLSYNYFELDVDVDKDGWHGAADSTQSGPNLSVSFSW
jgi:hypothetical protein